MEDWRHVNTRTKDEDSDVTGYGKHNRLLVFGDPKGKTVEIREDVRPGLAMSTEADRRKVLMGWQRQHPRGSRLEYRGSTAYLNRIERIEHVYDVV